MASAPEQLAAHNVGVTNIPPEERERLLSDLVDGEESFELGQLSLATPEKAHLLNRILDSPSVQSNRPTPQPKPTNARQLSAGKVSIPEKPTALDGPPTSQRQLVGSASAPSRERQVGTHGRSGSLSRMPTNNLAGIVDNPLRQNNIAVGRVTRKDSYRRITSPRVLEAAVRSASRSGSPRRLNNQTKVAQRGLTRTNEQQSTNSGWSSDEGWTVEMSEDSHFASDEFDSDSDDEARHSGDQLSHGATPTTNASIPSWTATPAPATHRLAAKVVHSVSPIHRANTGGIAAKHCSYFTALDQYEADDSDELDVEQGDILICRELEGEDGDSWLEAKRLPFTGDAWKLVPSAVVRPMSHMELNHTFGSDDDERSSLADDGESSVLLDDTDVLPDDEIRTQMSFASASGASSSRSLLKINSTSSSPARSDRGRERRLSHSPMSHRLSVVTHSSAGISPRRGQTSSPYSGDSDYGTASDSTESFSVGVPGSPYHGSSSAASTPSKHPRTPSIAATAASPALQLRKVFRQRSERSLRRHLAAVAAHSDGTSSDKYQDGVSRVRTDNNLSSETRARNEQGQNFHDINVDVTTGIDPLDPSSLRLAQALVEMRWKQQLVAQAQKELEKARAAAEVARRVQHAGVSEHCQRLAERLLPSFPFCGRLAREVNHFHLHHPHSHPSVAGEHVAKPALLKTDVLSRNREPKARHPETVHTLDSRKEDPSHLARVFLNCCARGNTDQLATFLLAYPNMDLNVQADDTMPNRLDNGATGILLATRGGHHDAVKFLLDRRADPTLASHRCDSPLQAAARRGDAVLFAMILDAGDDVSLRAYDNRGSPGSDVKSSLMMCLHQHPLICLVENIAVEHCKASAGLAVPKSNKTDTGSLFKRSVTRKPSSEDSATHVLGGRSSRSGSDKSVGTASSLHRSSMKDTASAVAFPSSPSTKSPDAQERAELSAALASILSITTQKWAENGLELAVGLNLGKSTPHVNPLAGWVTRRGHTPSTRLRDLLVAGALLEPFGPRLRSRAWKTVLGLLGPPPSEDALGGAGEISPATQAEKFEEARIRRYEGLCEQFLNSYKSDIAQCERLHRRADAGEKQSPPHAQSANDVGGVAHPVESEDTMLLTLRQIAVDLRRARKDFPTERLPALQRLLYVFAALHPSLGYVQGMHDIACAIYFHFHCERGRVASPRRDGRPFGGAPTHSRTALEPDDGAAKFVDSPRQRTPADWSDSSSGRSSRKDCTNTAERSHGGKVEGTPYSLYTSPLFEVCRAPDAVEASTFSVLNEVVGRCYLMQNIFQSKQYVDEFVRVFDAVLVSAAPDVAHFLSADGPIRGGGGALTADMFIFPWIFTLFSQGVKFGAVWKIWDRLFTGWLPADFVAGALQRAAGVKNAKKKSSGSTRDAAQPESRRSSSPGSAQATMHPWRIGVNPAYLVAMTVAIVVAVRDPLLACREFSTAMDILQSGLVILNGNNSFPASIHGPPGASAGDTNFYLSRFLDSAHDIYTNHALPIFRKFQGTFLVQENLASNPNTRTQHLKAKLPSKVAAHHVNGKGNRASVTANARGQQQSVAPLKLGLVLKSALQSRSASAKASQQPERPERAPSDPSRSAKSVQLAL